MQTSIYKIKRGDTLSAIAKNKKLGINEIMDVNPQLSNPDEIQAGQPINIPINHQQITTEWPAWYGLANQELEEDVIEITGEEDNPRIVQYHQSTTLKASDDETPWCSSFVNWCVQNTGFAGTNSAAARSWLRWGQPLKTPKTGCIVILKRGPHAWQGHVGFYAGPETNQYINVLGGNQSNRVKISTYNADKVLGYRWHD